MVFANSRIEAGIDADVGIGGAVVVLLFEEMLLFALPFTL